MRGTGRHNLGDGARTDGTLATAGVMARALRRLTYLHARSSSSSVSLPSADYHVPPGRSAAPQVAGAPPHSGYRAG